jgi:prepilin-type N-terminal cleavage/methylation domain-containing protein
MAGFTLVELLTVIAVIAILLGFLIPALSSIEKTALKVRQRAQFHSIEVALEAFATDMRDYPPSAFDAAYGNYTASQRLAEALVGRDGFGFHSDSLMREDGTDGTSALYYPDFAPADDAQRDANLAKRKGPYLELETANAVRLSNLYAGTSLGTLAATAGKSYVLADMYKITKNSATGKTTGSPILYYRSNRGKPQHHLNFAYANQSLNQCTYNVYDSLGAEGIVDAIADLVPLLTKSGIHPLAYASTGPSDPDGKALFYRQTTNPNFPGDAAYPASGAPPRPYRADSFILQSAGPDALYGTADDVFNFDPEN